MGDQSPLHLASNYAALRQTTYQYINRNFKMLMFVRDFVRIYTVEFTNYVYIPDKI